MIRPLIEDKDDYIQFNLVGIGHHGFDVTEDGEGVMRCNMSREELKRIGNAISFYRSHGGGK